MTNEDMWFVVENDHTIVATKIFDEEEAIRTAKEIHEEHCGRYHEVIQINLRTGRSTNILLLEPREYHWITYRPSWF